MTAVVIVGASVAGVRCATALRNAGFDGEVILLDGEAGAPYDKPQLSKRLAEDTSLTLLADDATLRGQRIDFRPAVTAVGVDVSARAVETSQGLVAYDDLVIATGCSPRPLPQPLPARAGYLRSSEDWLHLKDAVRRGGRLIVVGAGFLGLEAAAAAVSHGMEVTVVDVAPRVLMRGIVPSAADIIAARHLAEGVELALGVVAPVLEGDEHEVWVDGVRGDYALVSIGAQPNVSWLANSGLTLEDGVVCDTNLLAAPGIWAIGDCARWVNEHGGRLERHEHWTTAGRHAQHVAKSIATATRSPMAELPYVWSDQYDLKVQSVGRIGSDGMHFTSDTGAHVAISIADDQVTGVTTINAQALSMKARRLLLHEDPSVEEFLDALAITSSGLRRL